MYFLVLFKELKWNYVNAYGLCPDLVCKIYFINKSTNKRKLCHYQKLLHTSQSKTALFIGLIVGCFRISFDPPINESLVMARRSYIQTALSQLTAVYMCQY